MQAVLKAQINKTDRNDARGIAQMMRAGLYRPVTGTSSLASICRAETGSADHGKMVQRRAHYFGMPFMATTQHRTVLLSCASLLECYAALFPVGLE